MEENRKASAIARTLHQALEEKRVAATRHAQCLRLLRKYQLDKGIQGVDEGDYLNMLLEAGKDAVFELPPDSELDHAHAIPKEKELSAKITSQGPSIATGPGTELDHAHAIPKEKEPSVQIISSGPSITTGPSTTDRSRELTPESLSSFSEDSSMEYMPTLAL